MFRRSEPLDDAVWDKLMLGLSTRNYSKAVREFAAAYGIEKSAVSEHFVRTSREKLRELLERPLDKLKLCVIYIDGIEFKGQHLVAALGVAMDGPKTVLGLRQGASENTTVAGELLEDLAGRGVDFSAPMLYVLDGAKALTKAVRKHAGKTAPIQRCQMHKRRNVTGHLPEPYRESVDRKMANAYAMSSCADAKAALEKLHRELLELNPSAARSLEEGREETLTVHRLGLDDLLRCTLATTNPIESAFSVVDRVCGRGEALAGRRSARALGGRGSVAGREKLPAGQRLPALAEITRPARQTVAAASGPGPSGVNYKFWRAARFNGILDIL